MANKKFIPELHDIGKLVDDRLKDCIGLRGSRGRKHTFATFNFQKLCIPQPTSPSWWGQYHHENSEVNKDINQWNLTDSIGNSIPTEEKYHLFLLILADHLASSVSRATLELEKAQSQQAGVLKLWNKNFYQQEEKRGKHWAAFKTIDNLKILFDEIENCKSGEEFLNKYRDSLLLTPEDKSVPRNVTSLYTHVELVGKIYRVLEKNTKLITEPDGSIAIEYNGKKVKTIKEAEGDNFIYYKDKQGKEHYGNKGKWQARLVKCWIKFPHSFVRLQDINLLRKREELVNYIASHCKDEVIFATSDFIILFLPPNQELKEILKPLLDWGFYIEAEEILADLGILNSILDRKTLQARQTNDQARLSVLTNRDTKVYKRYLTPELPEEIQPPICDICQQRQGIERIKENVREWICDKCQEIRNLGEPFREYTTVWGEEGVKVCWFKFSLDQNKLEDWLHKAFEEYVDSYNFSKASVLKEEFRPLALQVDFNKDYKEMLKEFWKEFSRVDDIKKPIAEYDELGVFKYSPELTKMVIEKFLNLFEQYFPDCITDEKSPISLSLSIANIKYPIRDHWRYFEENNKNFINVRHHRVFDERYTKDELKIIIEKAVNVKTSSSFLHKLVQLEENLRSEIHIAVEIFNNRKKYPEIYEMLSKGIKPSKFLNLYRLLRGGEYE
ncbi:hypothetical protein [Thermosipho sp. (in: thermotogales)]|jgi:ribosomal protein L37AE/L43A|uniref:hypothetical protein n=1 Tax=Thermosipho sp. (in: thermotogales) TaxID=1968895 RepID=UPI00257F125C|nr:hypothetical protein [Thermosipho sp. (in: thermotogales)]MBZ4651056.1 hypothetical protein [Thermosipho sp. (in: thermotogales)]MDK2906864.1 hypothetical protein [Petrotoga sp.]